MSMRQVVTTGSRQRCDDQQATVGNVNHHRAGHITKPATFPWHDQLCLCHVMSQQHDAIAIQIEGRLKLAYQAYTSSQFKSLRRAARAFNVTH
jgi:hypothetical protein